MKHTCAYCLKVVCGVECVYNKTTQFNHQTNTTECATSDTLCIK